MTEHQLIRFLQSLAARPGGPLRVSVGDDCAVWRPRSGFDLLVTTDQLVEGIHFRRTQLPARLAAARLVGRGLSDLAAMGGRPRAVFLSLALPSEQRSGWSADFLRGFGSAVRKLGAAWAGGDISGTDGRFAAVITALGETPAGTAVLRSGAKPGDALYVTGTLGLRRRVIAPRLAVGAFLRRRQLATAMIDLSDGLSTDLHHLTEASGVGAELESARIPRRGSLDQALNYGEDYELLFTARRPVPAQIAGVRLSRIGRIVAGRAVLLDGRPLAARGWEHLRS
jgi:thiamine-monophosphate kinase